jgi:cobalt/nickel transport system permease protein
MANGHLHQTDIDAYAGMDSPIHKWDTRWKIVGLLGLIVGFAVVQDWRLLPIIILVTIIIYAISGLPWHVLRHRLTVPGFIVAAIIIFLPFISGTTVVATLGPINIYQEGIELSLLIAVRLFCIVTLAFMMFGTDTFVRTVLALRALRFPDIMADMVLLTYRYLYEISAFFAQMQLAARLRGFQERAFSRQNIGVLAALVGHLFIRSYEKSERVYKAMVLRGYGSSTVRQDIFQAVPMDYLKTTAALLLALTLILMTQVL